MSLWSVSTNVLLSMLFFVTVAGDVVTFERVIENMNRVDDLLYIFFPKPNNVY